ncbi:MAG: DNA mismatch repair protein MutS [Phycisphaeraceae bacterium]|nr:DNA mismatch repair protein MutS [Phycisphaeraceae bacterium]
MADPRDTPAMRQYYRFKRQHPDCLLLIRIGDFYECFDDDAITLSKAAGLTLTKRTEGVPMAGMPFHQLETYLRRLIDKGYRVAVADQMQDAAEAKGLIERAVTRVLTPGTLVDETLLASDAACALAAACFLDSGDAPEGRVAAAVVEVSTGRFAVFETTAGALADEFARRQVTEVLFAQTADGATPPRMKVVLDALGLAGTPQPSWHFRHDEALEAVLAQFGVATLEGFGIQRDDPVIRAAGAAIRYLRQTQGAGEEEGASGSASAGTGRKRAGTLAHLHPPRKEENRGHLHLDAIALRALEVLGTMRGDVGRIGSAEAAAGDGSLVGIFADPGCRTAMGRRLLREWLCRPLCDRAAIEMRHSCVATLISDRRAAAELGEALEGVQDVPRMAARIAMARATPRDVVGLGRSVGQVRVVADALENAPAFAGQLGALRKIEAELGGLAEKIAAACVEAPPAHLREGGLVRDGVDAELDEARLLQRDSAEWMAQYQKDLIEKHDLPSLKVGYNKIFGYYIELPSAQSRRAPAEFTRKQTLKSAERYITPELREYERKVTTAETRAIARELAIFESLCAGAAALAAPITAFADIAAELDVLLCFADKAARRGWARPEIVEEPVLRIVQGRHPVLDELLEGAGGGFVPNDIELGGIDEGQVGGAACGTLALITGPNMAGKSTFIRQTALLVLLAHCGSYVPAAGATIGLTDRIFTRVGADDALHAGQSTFMVEMTETARILHHATARSLVVLDEIGRGTSTLDGLSLAWAIAETLAAGSAVEVASEAPSPRGSERGGRGEVASPFGRAGEGFRGPRTLFATHYHELTRLEELMPGCVQNLHVSVREWGDEIVFLHRILPGKTDRSYGIHVAKLAGMPTGTVARAREVLESLAVHQAEGVDGSSTGILPVKGEGDAEGNWDSAVKPRRGKRVDTSRIPPAGQSDQLALFTQFVQHPAVDQLREVKIEALTPLEAFDTLRKLKGMAGE